MRLAERGVRPVVINADSAQVYADLQIVSARPTQTDMRGIPHRLFGAWDGAVACSAADWAAAAKREVENAHLAGELPILVGGTGLYIRTLLDGIAPIPPIDPAIRAAVRALPTNDAYAALADEDPERHAVLEPGDSQRIARALEIVRSTGRPQREWQERTEGGIADSVRLAPAILLPDRERLFERCAKRFDAMIAAGALEEVARLLQRRLDPDLPIMRAIGVPELSAVAEGMLSLQEACDRATQATRQYARRQYTWFRNQPPQDWMRLSTKSAVTDALTERLFPD